MFDPRRTILRSLRYYSPTDDIRESFYVKGNTIYSTDPHVWEKSESRSVVSEPIQKIAPYIRKTAKNIGTGKKRVSGYKRKPAPKSLQERLSDAENPEPFIRTALKNGLKAILKYR